MRIRTLRSRTSHYLVASKTIKLVVQRCRHAVSVGYLPSIVSSASRCKEPLIPPLLGLKPLLFLNPTIVFSSRNIKVFLHVRSPFATIPVTPFARDLSDLRMIKRLVRKIKDLLRQIARLFRSAGRATMCQARNVIHTCGCIGPTFMIRCERCLPWDRQCTQTQERLDQALYACPTCMRAVKNGRATRTPRPRNHMPDDEVVFVPRRYPRRRG